MVLQKGGKSQLVVTKLGEGVMDFCSFKGLKRRKNECESRYRRPGWELPEGDPA